MVKRGGPCSDCILVVLKGCMCSCSVCLSVLIMATGSSTDPIVIEDAFVSSPVKILEGRQYR